MSYQSVIVHMLLCFFLVTSVSGCTALKYAAEARVNPPFNELVSPSSGEVMDLYSVETDSEPRDVLFFVSGPG